MRNYKIMIRKTHDKYEGHLYPEETSENDDDENPWVEECSSREAVEAGLRAIARVMKWKVVS